MGMGFTTDDFDREIARCEVILQQYKNFGEGAAFEIQDLSHLIEKAKSILLSSSVKYWRNGIVKERS